MAHESDAIEVRPLGEGDWAAILKLVSSALGPGPSGQRTVQWWRWKHVDNPYGESLVLGAFAKGQLVGLRAFLRWDMRWQGSVWRCARAVDTATHPDWQGRGVFRSLTLAGLEALRRENITQVFNTPNPKSGAGYLKMGWKSVAELRACGRPSLVGLMVRASRYGRPLQPMINPNASNGYLTPQEALTPHRLDDLVRSLNESAANKLSTAWSVASLRWRFIQCPVAQYGVIVRDDRVAAIIRFNRRRRLREGVISLVNPSFPKPAKLLNRRLAAQVDYWVWRPGPATVGSLQAAATGFLEVPVSIMNLFYRPVRMSEQEEKVSARLDNWHLCFADLELL